jgi:hypothetical protein
VFREAGWSKARFKQALFDYTTVPAEDVLTGVDGMTPGAPESARGKMLAKLRPTGLDIVHAGGNAGLFSGLLVGWTPGNVNSNITTKEVKE